jgi:hypothetical protein
VSYVQQRATAPVARSDNDLLGSTRNVFGVGLHANPDTLRGWAIEPGLAGHIKQHP